MKDEPTRVGGTAWRNEETLTAQLREAIATWERHYAQQPIQRDFVAHAENVSAWIAMTSAHPLVEQTLKAVLRKRGKAEAVLRGVAGHDLGTLYDALPAGDKRAAEQGLLAFARRYGGVPWEGVAEFLSSVAHDYVGWRYLLIELPPCDLATTHPEALMAVAKGLAHGLAEPAASPKAKGPESSRPAERSERPAPPQCKGTKRTSSRPRKLWREESLRVDGLNNASQRLKLHLGDEHFLVDSIGPDHRQSASAWMAIVCGYSLVEQALKALLHRRGDPRAERGGYGGHQIDKLYKWLPEADKAVIEQGFAAYGSLFEEIADPSASEFLRRVGGSYNDWRYLLVERPRKQLSAIHPAALIEVVRLVVEILVNETFTDHGMHYVARRLHDRIWLSGINESLRERTLERLESGLPQEEMDPLNEWLREAPNLLTGFASYLRGETPDSDLVADVLKRAERRLDQAAARPGCLDLRRFLERARDRQASPLKWDSAACLFVRDR